MQTPKTEATSEKEMETLARFFLNIHKEQKTDYTAKSREIQESNGEAQPVPESQANGNVEDLCKLLEMSKKDLHKKCDQYLIAPTCNEIGQSVFSKYDVRKLHNKLYYEGLERSS